MLLPLNIWTSTIYKKIILYSCLPIRTLLTPHEILATSLGSPWFVFIDLEILEKIESYADESLKQEFSKQLFLTFWVWNTPSPSNLKPPLFRKGREEFQGFPAGRKFLKIDGIDIETHFSTCWYARKILLIHFVSFLFFSLSPGTSTCLNYSNCDPMFVDRLRDAVFSLRRHEGFFLLFERCPFRTSIWSRSQNETKNFWWLQMREPFGSGLFLKRGTLKH